jgi:2-phospho-L-lactate guanylyltransferase (CobY/MobA/RfbA family)
MEQRALLIFADSAHTDCKRRGWPNSFRILLETQGLGFGERTGCDVHLFTSRGSYHVVPASCQVHDQEGASFGQRLGNAIEQLAGIGYQEMVIVGSDCPDLAENDIVDAFALLRQHRLVLGPDHRGGCYLIAIHANDRGKFKGIRWQRNTDFRQILDRFGNEDVYRLSVKIDLDSLSDVWLLARSPSQWSSMAKLLRELLLNRPCFYLRTEKTYPIENQREYWQLPPPVTQTF